MMLDPPELLQICLPISKPFLASDFAVLSGQPLRHSVPFSWILRNKNLHAFQTREEQPDLLTVSFQFSRIVMERPHLFLETRNLIVRAFTHVLRTLLSTSRWRRALSLVVGRRVWSTEKRTCRSAAPIPSSFYTHTHCPVLAFR